MNGHARVLAKFLCVSLVLLLAACSQATASDDANQGSVNGGAITIDGSGDDWSEYPVLADDPAGDQKAGAPDLGEFKAFMNDQYLYVLIQLRQAGAAENYQLDFTLDGETQARLNISLCEWKIEIKNPRASAPVSVASALAVGEAIEAKISLAAFGTQQIQIDEVAAKITMLDSGDFYSVGLPVARIGTEPESTDALAAAPPATTPCEGPEIYFANLDAYQEVLFNEEGISFEQIYEPLVKPWQVVIGPNDEILILGDKRSIYQLGENGDVSLYIALSEKVNDQIEHFGFDTEGRLWFSTLQRGIYRVNEDGNAERMVEGDNLVFDFDSQGNMYFISFAGSNVQRLSPDGEQSLVAYGFGQVQRIKVGPDDEILVIEQRNGELLQIFEDGTWQKIVGGLSYEEAIAIAPDGSVYLITFGKLAKVDLENRTATPLNWARLSGEDGVFDSQGRLYAYHVGEPFVRLDLETQTVEVLYRPFGNSFGISAGSGDRVLAAYGDHIPGGIVSVFEVQNGQLESLGTFPYQDARSAVVAADGVAYVSMLGPNDRENENDSAIYQFDLDTGDSEIFYQACCGAFEALTFNPTDGRLWWAVPEGLQFKGASGSLGSLSFPQEIGFLDLAFNQAGKLYLLNFDVVGSPNDTAAGPGALFNWQIYAYTPEENWTLLASNSNTHDWLNSIAACPNGQVYIGGVTFDGGSVAEERSGELYVLWRLDGDSITPIAYNVTADPWALACDPVTGNLFHGNVDGIGRFTFED